MIRTFVLFEFSQIGVQLHIIPNFEFELNCPVQFIGGIFENVLQ